MLGTAIRLDKYFEQTGYFPHAAQEELHYTPARFKVVPCGRRWGKTLAGAKEHEPRAFVPNRYGEPQRGWIVGPTYTDAEKEFRVIYDSLRKLGVDKTSIKFVNNVDSGNMHITTNWGFDLQCRSAKHPETLVGEGLDFVLMVEAGRHKRRTWAEYVRPALSDKKGTALFTGVPEGATENSLLYALFQRGMDPTKKSWRSLSMPSWTNTIVFPGGRQDPEILEAYDDLTEDEFDRQYGAKFGERTGRVMGEWDDDVHVAHVPYNPALPLYLGTDSGFTNPFRLLWIQVDDLNQVRVIRERSFVQTDTPDIIRDMKENPIDAALIRAAVGLYPEPAAPEDAVLLSNGFKIPTRGSTGGELRIRLTLIRQALKTRPTHVPEGHPDRKPGLIVDRSCQHLIWEMREGYRWPEHRSEIRSDSEHPLDKDNHSVEALGRFFRGYFGQVEQETRRAKVKKAAYR